MFPERMQNLLPMNEPGISSNATNPMGYVQETDSTSRFNEFMIWVSVIQQKTRNGLFSSNSFYQLFQFNSMNNINFNFNADVTT